MGAARSAEPTRIATAATRHGLRSTRGARLDTVLALAPTASDLLPRNLPNVTAPSVKSNN
jgi:hypothetical protein